MSAVTAPLRRSRRTTKTPGRGAVDRRAHLKVVPEPKRRHTLLYALAAILLLGAAVFATVTLNALAAAHAVEARGLEARVAEGERQYAQLVADVAALENPARIREAATELGMVPAGPGRHLVLDRALPADGAVAQPVTPGITADPLKPVLSADR